MLINNNYKIKRVKIVIQINKIKRLIHNLLKILLLGKTAMKDHILKIPMKSHQIKLKNLKSIHSHK